MQTKQLNIRLTPEESAELKALADGCEVTPAALGGFFMRAALRASKNQRLKLPLDFEIVEGLRVPEVPATSPPSMPLPHFSLNEPKPYKKRR